MKIDLDRNRCEGHGICEVVAPDYFALDDDSNLTILAEDVSAADEAQVTDAVMACPVAAIKLRLPSQT